MGHNILSQIKETLTLKPWGTVLIHWNHGHSTYIETMGHSFLSLKLRWGSSIGQWVESGQRVTTDYCITYTSFLLDIQISTLKL